MIGPEHLGAMPSLRSVAAFCAAACLTAVANADSLTCQSLESTSNISIDHPLDLAYTSENSEYWSTGCAALKPACIIKPASAQEMSAVIKALNQNDEKFAVKSGGHNPNQNFSSIDGGPLVSTANLNEVTFDEASMTVRVGPGNRWEDVHKTLDGTGVTVVGGRIGNVGVGGYIVGGGLSFLSAEYGWAANNVVEFELVLANGTITTASSSTNADVFKALKAGGANFGVVTAYTLKAHPIGQVWGGNLIFDSSKSAALLHALQNFTQNYPDEKAGIILTSEITGANLVHIWIMFLFYDGPTPPAGVFDMFTSLSPITNNAKTRSYYDLLSYNNWAVLKGSFYTIATETVTLLDPSTPAAVNTTYGVLEDCYAHWVNVSRSYAAVPGLVASMAFQPFPAAFARKALAIDQSLGGDGDLLALDDSADRVIFEFDFSYLKGLAATDVKVDQATREVYEGMGDVIDAAVADGRAPAAYRPLFMNDGYHRQDYWARIAPESKTFAEDVKGRVDPDNFWGERSAGGFLL